MSKRTRRKETRLCPFRKMIELETDDLTERTVERVLFQPCVGKKCMAYVYAAPFIEERASDEPSNWTCARIQGGLRIAEK